MTIILLKQSHIWIPIGVFVKTFHCPSTIRTIQFDLKLSRKKKNLAVSSLAIFLIDVHLKWFDSLVEPIILYGSEVWGFENIQIMERIHLKFCKRISNVRLSTPNYMVYGELVRYPLEIRVKLRMVSFWTKHVQSENKLSSNLYRLMLQIHQSGNHDFKWISFVMSIFDITGLIYICVNQLNINIHSLKPVLKERLYDHFIQQ